MPNFTISSENKTNSIQTLFEDIQVTTPPGTVGPFLYTITPEGGVEVGPFVAGEEGKVTLKAYEFRAGFGDGPLALGYSCSVPENEEFILASVEIDSEAPVITLNGDNPMIVKQGDPYVELGVTAVDNIDGKLSEDQIEISGEDEVDTDTIGEYTVTYTVSDSVGNVASVERTVNVVEPFGSWFTGEGPSSDSLGSNGDSYLDITTGDVYKRDPNTWNKTSSNLKGDDGKQGSGILTGSGAPSDNAGDVGDLYFDSNAGDVYEKTANGWKSIANLQGPARPQGPKGSAGSSGGSKTGGDGDGKQSGGKKVSAKGDGDGKSKSAQGGKLPKTVTSLPTFILIGTLLAAAGGVLFLRRRKAIE